MSVDECRMSKINGWGGVDEIQKALAHERMKNGFKVASGGDRAGARPSREDNLRKLGTVYSAIGGENRLAEARDDGGDGRAAWRFQLVNDIVRV